jgi:hypothetical protein
VSAFFRRAEEILEIATTGNAGLGDALMVLDRQGGFRMLKPDGWSLPAAAAEFGAEAVYKVERRGSSVRVEGWNGSERCLLQGQTSGGRARNLLGLQFAAQATMFQFASLAIS